MAIEGQRRSLLIPFSFPHAAAAAYEKLTGSVARIRVQLCRFLLKMALSVIEHLVSLSALPFQLSVLLMHYTWAGSLKGEL